MINKSVCGVFILLLLHGLAPSASRAGVPTEQVRGTVDKVLTVLQGSRSNSHSEKDGYRSELVQAIAARFDFEDMAKRSLGSQWQRCLPEQRREFVRLFTDLLEKSYLDKIESYNGEKVLYMRENQDSDLAEVDTKIVSKRGDELSINYKLRAAAGDWKIYDVVIENISLVNNYRSQFNRVLAKSSFEDLLQRLKEKQ